MTSEPQQRTRPSSAWSSRVVGAHFDDEDALIVDVAGYEGPLDLLLRWRARKKLTWPRSRSLSWPSSIWQFIAEARSLRLEIAADYLVTAAWLAFLKSQLLLPVEAKQDDGPSGEEMALPSPSG